MPTFLQRPKPFKSRRGRAPFSAPTPPVTVAVDDANMFFSPYNWFISGSTYAESNNPGAYLKTKFTGTSVKLNVDVSPLTGASVGSGSYPRILYRIDSNAYTSRQLTSADTQITLGTGLSDTTHTLEIVFISVYTWDVEDRWDTPVAVLRITGLEIDAGKTTAAPDVYAGRMIVYGDSHTEGWEITSAGGAQDASLTYGIYLGRAFECEVGIIAFAGQGWTVQVGMNSNTPDFEDSWDFYHDGESRLSGGSFIDGDPDYIIIAQGANDSAGVQAAVEATLAAIRTAAPSAEIMVALPPNLDEESAITAGVAAVADASIHLIDHGENILTGPWVFGSHVSQRGHAKWAAILAKMIQETQGGGGGAGPFGGVFSSPVIRAAQ